MKHFISLGAGVQSSTMALMAAHGEIEPMPDGAIFADTQAEPKAVYEWLGWLEKRLPFPVHRVTAGNLGTKALEIHESRKGLRYFKVALPYHMDGESPGVLGRKCTSHYKIRPIEKALRRLASVKRGTTDKAVVSWIGISLEEMARAKPSRTVWIENRWPLIEKRMTRAACLAWLDAKGYPEPPRSACVFCPFRSNAEWRHLRMTDPSGFAVAVRFDAEARAARGPSASVPYVHSSRLPLAEADLKNDVDRGQLLLWQDECTGMCGV